MRGKTPNDPWNPKPYSATERDPEADALTAAQAEEHEAEKQAAIKRSKHWRESLSRDLWAANPTCKNGGRKCEFSQQKPSFVVSLSAVPLDQDVVWPLKYTVRAAGAYIGLFPSAFLKEKQALEHVVSQNYNTDWVKDSVKKGFFMSMATGNITNPFDGESKSYIPHTKIDEYLQVDYEARMMGLTSDPTVHIRINYRHSDRAVWYTFEGESFPVAWTIPEDVKDLVLAVVVPDGVNGASEELSTQLTVETGLGTKFQVFYYSQWKGF